MIEREREREILMKAENAGRLPSCVRRHASARTLVCEERFVTALKIQNGSTLAPSLFQAQPGPSWYTGYWDSDIDDSLSTFVKAKELYD